MLISTFPGWETTTDPDTGWDVDVKPFPSRPISQLALSAAALASLFCAVSALWQHTSAASASTRLEASALGVVKATIGPIATSFVWISFALLATGSAALLMMLATIFVLDKLTDPSDEDDGHLPGAGLNMSLENFNSTARQFTFT